MPQEVGESSLGEIPVLWELRADTASVYQSPMPRLDQEGSERREVQLGSGGGRSSVRGRGDERPRHDIVKLLHSAEAKDWTNSDGGQQEAFPEQARGPEDQSSQQGCEKCQREWRLVVGG